MIPKLIWYEYFSNIKNTVHHNLFIMKKYLLLNCFFLLVVKLVLAQNVAINNDASLPNSSALLDIKSSTKGLLIPRMNSAAVAGIVNPAKGLLVLDTLKNQLMVNMGTALFPNWQTIVASSGWSLTGNSGTDPVTHFIGTIDTRPFIIKVNNVRSGYVDSINANTSFGFRSLDSITTGTLNTAIGYKSLTANKTGGYNTGLGYNALTQNSSGSFNTASGVHSLYSNTTGSQNTAFGQLAMAENITGGQNTAVGSDALRYNSSGNANIGIGFTSLYFNTTGYSNIAVGTGALFNTGNRNNLVAVGDSALFNNGTGATQAAEATANTALGSKALFSNSKGYFNTATGSNALKNNTTGAQNTANGTGALVSNTIGNSNTAMGLNALFQNTSGNDNTAIGNFTAINNSTGSRNTGTGTAALGSNTIGNNNTATGHAALYFNTTGHSNVAIGSEALVNNTTRSNLVAVGDSALYKNGMDAVNPYEATENSALGSKALFANTTGYYNTATGSNALRSNSTGAQNTANGTGAMVNNTIGNANTAMGLNTMAQNNTGNDNSAVGNFALVGNTAGSRNTGLGSGALGTNSTGNNNTAIGYAADVSTANLSNATAIGYNAKVAASNSLVLGGMGADAVKVGIGTSTPMARLHVADSNVLYTGPATVPVTTTYNPPASGAGSRMMWYPQKAAFRVGNVNSTEWDKDNIGRYSFSSGINTKATAEASTSMGFGTTANGYISTSLGLGTTASGNYSTSMGESTTASGYASTSMGGGSSIASGNYSTSMGAGSKASGYASTSMGLSTKAKSNYSLVTGLYNDSTATNRLFEIGNGTADNARSNAMTVLINGNVGIGSTNPTKQTEIIGAASATPVTLVIGNRGGFGPSALEFVSDYGLANQWRPGYIRNNDIGGFTGALEFYTNGSGVLYGSVKGLEVRNGSTYTATGSVNSWSDDRLKTNVQPFTNGLDIINLINPVSFNYNQQSPFQTEKLQIGVLAQELEKVAPYMVDKNVTKDIEDLRSVNNQAYIFLLINAVKEQNKKIENQQQQIDELKALIEKK